MSHADLSALEAATALHGLREARGGTERRAAGLSLMVWALVITSMAGTMVASGLAQFRLAEANGGDFAAGGWMLFVLSSVALLVFWVAVGTLMQRLVFRSFSVRPRPADAPWRAALVAAGIVVASVFVFGALQSLTRALQGIGTTPDQYDALHHNLGTAVALTIASTVFLAMVVTQGDLGLPRWRAGAIALAGMVLGHLTTFLWFPDLGMAGALVAMLVLPVGLITFGMRLWRQG